MNSALRDALYKGVEHVFFQFSDLLAMSGGETEVGSSQTLCAYMDVTGFAPGRLYLMGTVGLCDKVLKIMFPHEAPNPDLQQDMACELLNMVAESTRTLLNQWGNEFEVGVPQAYRGKVHSEANDEDAVFLKPMGEAIRMWCIACPDEPNVEPES